MAACEDRVIWIVKSFSDTFSILDIAKLAEASFESTPKAVINAKAIVGRVPSDKMSHL